MVSQLQQFPEVPRVRAIFRMAGWPFGLGAEDRDPGRTALGNAGRNVSVMVLKC